MGEAGVPDVHGTGPRTAYGSSVNPCGPVPLSGSSGLHRRLPPLPPPATPPPAEPGRTGVTALCECGPSPQFHHPSPLPSTTGPLSYTIPGLIPVVDEKYYEYGNVRRYLTGVSAYIDPELAQAIPKGVRVARSDTTHGRNRGSR
eukprot:2066867-Prymnesium_polylepis.1